jgi:hypothetical protein
MTKVNNNKTARKAKPIECNPIRDIMCSPPVECTSLTKADVDFLQSLAETPTPAPSAQLVEDLRQHLRKR